MDDARLEDDLRLTASLQQPSFSLLSILLKLIRKTVNFNNGNNA